MNYEQIQEIIRTMIDSNLTSLELEVEGVSLKLKKNAAEEREIVKIETEKKEVKPLREAPLKNIEAVQQPKVQEVKPQVVNETADGGNIKGITSPIVGTFYISSGPGKDNFVSVGSKVKKGQTLCIIEAMKLMNEIEAEVDGEVIEILVNNEQMVEYGQTLFKIRVEG
jgi:acetyl-CoA carboxylase biotin carboxyl carrier protein